MLPKYCIVHDTPDHLWGVVRLRNPVLIIEMDKVGEDTLSTYYKPLVWPPDAKALTTEKKFHDCLTTLWHVFGSYADDGATALMYEFDLARELPRYLVLDNEKSDFTGVLDTRDGVLWSVDETCTRLDALLEWKMHPAMSSVIEFPRSTREVGEFWKTFCADQKRMEKK